MPRWMQLFAHGLLLLAVAGIMAGCGKRESRVDRGTREGILYINNGAEPQELDPHVVTGVPEQRISTALFEGLCNLDPATLNPTPGVAESWTVSPDGLHYTFHLRETARWSNGDPLRAADFVASWKRNLSPGLASEYAYLLFCLVNAQAFHEGKLSDFDQVGVKARDPFTLEVTLANPVPYFLTMLYHTAWLPVPIQVIEKHGRLDERGTRWTLHDFVGNGPFMLAEWNPDVVLVVKRNPLYWDADHVRLNGIRFYPIDNLQTEERCFRSGELHITESVLTSKIPVYQQKSPDLIRSDPYLGTYYYRLNVSKPPFTDARVRRAFSMAINRDELVQHVLKAGQQPAYCFTPPNTAGYTARGSLRFDVAGARALLAEAGYPDGQGLPPVELLYNTSENHKLIAEAFQEMWQQNLHVSVALVNQDWKVYLSAMTTRNYQMARSGWIGDYLDPVAFLECFTTGNGNNRTGYSSEKYDALIQQSRQTADHAARLELLQQAETILLEDSPIIPVYFYTRTYLKSPYVKGWQTNLLGYLSFKNMVLEQ